MDKLTIVRERLFRSPLFKRLAGWNRRLEMAWLTRRVDARWQERQVR